MSNKVIVLGPGKTSLEFDILAHDECTILAFQEVFPNCISHLGVVPDYWTAGDPNSFINGMQYLLQNKDKKEFNKVKILFPSVFNRDLSYYRMFCGTTPIMRVPNGWYIFKELVKEVSIFYEVQIVPVTTTKYIKLFEKDATLKSITDEGEEYIRFMTDKAVLGTVEYDSETVAGTKYKWGLENKLTSVVLPICYSIGAKKVIVYGFDYQGPRFYSEDARHPWNDETQNKDASIHFSLNLLKKWVEWEQLHGMKIYSGTKQTISLPNKILNFYQEKM